TGVKVCAATATAPRRSASVLAATTSSTVPLPDPLAPDAIPIQLALLDAFHEQPPGAVTPTGTLPPLLPMFWFAGEMSYVQPTSCVTVNVCPPTAMGPVRDAPAFGATL